MAEVVWSAKRKWMGNLIPVFFMLPFVVAGVIHMVREEDFTWLGIGLCGGGLFLGWMTVNQFGFFGNANLKREIVKRVLSKAGRDASGGVFVGFARPSYVGILDAHEDLGFLFLDKNSIEYIGEVHHVSIPRGDVLGVRYRPNIHSALGLGRWVSVEAKQNGEPVRLLIEPREARTLLGNKRRGKQLRAKIEAWRKAT